MINHTTSPESHPCPVCEAAAMQIFFSVAKVPVFCNVLWPSAAKALAAPVGDIQLAVCHDCGHIYNVAFDASLLDYSVTYENSLHYSPRFQQFAEDLAQHLTKTFALDAHKAVIDVGCGKGDFLKLLCETSGCAGTGFDRSFDPTVHEDLTDRVQFVQDFYSPAYHDVPAHLITCRHVLEHIEQPQAFLKTLAETIGPRSIALYLEVPNALYTLRDMGIWDVIYEHCSYFTPVSLSIAGALSGFDVFTADEVYGEQFVHIEARAAHAPRGVMHTEGHDRAQQVSHVVSLATQFADNYQQKHRDWQERLTALKAEGKRIAVWGAGSKGVTFLNVMHTANCTIDTVIDINPRKVGQFVAGTGQCIVSPDDLADTPPDAVLVMNPLYTDEIASMLNERNLKPEIICV